MNELSFFYVHKSYPYQDESYDPNIYWCEMILKIIDKDKNEITTIFDIEWDLRPFLNWFDNNKYNLLNERFFIGNLKTSLAEFFYNYYDSELEVDDEEEERVFEYRERHGLRFALRGTDVKDCYIGLNNEKCEISYYDNRDDNFRIFIDIEKFIEDINNLSKKIKN